MGAETGRCRLADIGFQPLFGVIAGGQAGLASFAVALGLQQMPTLTGHQVVIRAGLAQGAAYCGERGVARPTVVDRYLPALLAIEQGESKQNTEADQDGDGQDTLQPMGRFS